MSHDPWEKSANVWEIPGKFILFCSALGALLLSIAQLWQPLPLLSEGRSKDAGIADAVTLHPGTVSIENKVVCCIELLFSLLPAPTSQKKLHLKGVCTE